MSGQAPSTAESRTVSANKEMVRKIFDELINKKDLTAADRYFAVNNIDHSAFADQAPGREGIKAAIKGMIEAYPDIKVEIQEMIAESDIVVTREMWTATEQSSGNRKSGWVLHMLKINNGLVTDEWSKGWEWME